MSIAFSPEVKELFFPSTTGFDHFLFTGPVRGDDTVAFHLAFISHYTTVMFLAAIRVLLALAIVNNSAELFAVLKKIISETVVEPL